MCRLSEQNAGDVVQSNLSNSKLKGPQKKKKKKKSNYPEFDLGKLCSKYIIVKGPIRNFELFTNSNYISSN